MELVDIMLIHLPHCLNAKESICQAGKISALWNHLENIVVFVGIANSKSGTILIVKEFRPVETVFNDAVDLYAHPLVDCEIPEVLVERNPVFKMDATVKIFHRGIEWIHILSKTVSA